MRVFVLYEHNYDDSEIVSVHRTLDGARKKAGAKVGDKYEVYTNNVPVGCFSRTYVASGSRPNLVAYEFELED